MANSVDPDQASPPVGAVWSGSALFAQTCLSENLGYFCFFSWLSSAKDILIDFLFNFFFLH